MRRNTFKFFTIAKAQEANSGPINLFTAKQVLRKKTGSNGTVFLFKFYIIARGFWQRKKVDYNKTFASILRLALQRIFLAFAAFYS